MGKKGNELLSALVVERAKHKDKTYMLRDGSGLYLVVEAAPSKRKWWKYRITFAGKQNTFSFGEYPDVTLAKARAKRASEASTKAEGVDPSALRKAAKSKGTGANSFEDIAREWHKKWTDAEWSQSHSKNILVRLEKHIFPWLKDRPADKILPLEMLSIFRRIESTGHLVTLHRTITNCSQIFRHAIFTGRATVDPCFKMGEAFPDPIKKHYPTLTEPIAVGALLRAIDNHHGDFVVRCALMLAPHVMLRPVEMRLAEWTEFNFEDGLWIIPIRRMKRTRRDKEAFPNEVHIVPLSTQAISILREIQALTGNGKLVFRGRRGQEQAINETSVSNGLRRMGYDKDTQSIHGFRAMARTMCKEQLKIDADVLERQLSHSIDNPLGKAYDRTTMMPERVAMMQAWSDYLDRLRRGADIIPIRKAM